MTNPVHLLTVASLLLAAFLLGAIAGTLLRLLVLRLTRKPAAAVVSTLEAPASPPPLVAAPVIAPLPVTPAPVPPPPSEVPVPDFAATLIALAAESPPPSFMEAVKPAEPQPLPQIAPLPTVDDAPPITEMQPARVAGATTSGRLVPAPLHDDAPEPTAAPAALAEHTADVIPFPSAAPEPKVDRTADNAAEPEAAPVAEVVEATSTDVSEQVEPEADAPPPVAAEPEQVMEAVPAAAEASSEAEIAAELPPSGAMANPEIAMPVEAASAPLAAPPSPIQSESEPTAEVADGSLDENAAMRAIEGNWTPPRPVRPAPAPAPDGVNQAVAASARAVAAARRTAEAAVAEVAVEAGRPVGLDAPRDGGKDDLTHIIGVLPVIETALNRLGIYHFYQIGALSDENIAWIEGHLGVPGRISRELWREQARELSAVLKPKRVAES